MLRWVFKALEKHPGLRMLIKRIYRSRRFQGLYLYHLYVHFLARRADRRAGQTRPVISIETTIVCNARCKMCLHSKNVLRGTMTMPLFKRIVEQCRSLGIQTVGLSVYGEPMCDRQFLERASYIASMGMEFVFFSNGSMLSEEIGKKLVETGGWLSVNFSVNGYSTEIYERIMPPLKRDVVYENINTLLKYKNESGQGPSVNISCVAQCDNVSEIDAFIKYWTNIKGVDGVIIADCGNWLGSVDDGLVVANKSRSGRSGTWLAPCSALWGGLYVLYDGRVIPCCEDSATRELIVGDCGKQTIDEIWHGKELSALRALHLKGERRHHPVCGKCRVNFPWLP